MVQDLASNPVNGHQILYFTAHEHMKYLRDLSGETLGLQVRSGGKGKIGPDAITDRASLLKELEKIRWQGYATSFNEYGSSAAVIAVPITGYFSSVALGIVGPGERFLDKRMNFLKPLIKSATQISEKLNQASTDK